MSLESKLTVDDGHALAEENPNKWSDSTAMLSTTFKFSRANYVPAQLLYLFIYVSIA